MKLYKLKTTLDVGEYAGCTVAEALEKNKKCIFQMIKEYKLYFSDEVLELAGIKKIIHDRQVKIEWQIHENKGHKKLKKDNKNLDEIMDEIEEDRHKLVFEDIEIINENDNDELIQEYGIDPIIIDTNLDND